MMERNAQQLLNLVNQLLDLSKLEAGKLKLEAVKSDVVSFIHALGSAFESMADHKRIEYRFNLSEGKIGLYFDRNKLETIVNNLLSNAFKFTPEGGKVELALKKLIEGDKEWVEIRVIDSGHGIPEDQTEKIFDRFYQTDSSQTREQEGTGIGLALTKELIKLHHGSIQVQSEMGKGTTFIILLPVGKDHLKEEEIIQELTLPDLEKEKGLTTHQSEFVLSEDGVTEEKAHPKEELETESLLPIVLMVEDNPDVRSYIRDILGNNYSVLEAENGKKGLKKAQETIPDLILSDVMMPNMDGIELCKRLKTDERTSHIPVIILTAKGSGNNKIEGLETGVDDYIIKPFEAQELLVRIKNLIQQRNMLREKFRKEIILKPKDIAITSTDERFLNKVMEVMDANIDNEMFSVKQLGENVSMSRSQILRKLQGLTGQSASQFIRNFRLQRAMELLKKDAGTVSEIAYKVGFGSPAYFVKCFRERHGYPPGKFKSRMSTTDGY
jgi:DNA-binding response OmpR family regulator